MTPLVIVDITEGVEQARWTFAGEGVPELLIQDFDRGDLADDDLPYLIERAELFARALRSRHLVDCADDPMMCLNIGARVYETTAQEWRDDLAENARSAEEDRRMEQLREDRITEAAERAGMAPGELTELFGK